MKIEKSNDGFGNTEYTFTEDNLVFKMYYGGNLDLHWEIQNNDVNMDNYEEYAELPLEFVISPEYPEVYMLFSELFDSVKSLAMELESEYALKEKAKMEALDELVYVEDEKEVPVHELIVRNNVVVWHSDETELDLANYVTITRIDGNMLLTFRKGVVVNDIPGTITIRFRNNGSKYAPFNVYFMKLFSSMEKVRVVSDISDQVMKKLTN